MDTAVSLKCPRCGAPVDIADSKTEMLSCPYCDATFKNPSYDPNAVAEAAAQVPKLLLRPMQALRVARLRSCCAIFWGFGGCIVSTWGKSGRG